MTARKTVSKKKWREEMEESLQVVFDNIFRHRDIKSVIRVKIAENPLDRKYYLTECGKSVNQEGRTYKVFAVQKENLTEIYVFERNMSEINANKSFLIEDNEKIDEEQKYYYCKSIVNFLLANII